MARVATSRTRVVVAHAPVSAEIRGEREPASLAEAYARRGTSSTSERYQQRRESGVVVLEDAQDLTGGHDVHAGMGEMLLVAGDEDRGRSGESYLEEWSVLRGRRGLREGGDVVHQDGDGLDAGEECFDELRLEAKLLSAEDLAVLSEDPLVDENEERRAARQEVTFNEARSDSARLDECRDEDIGVDDDPHLPLRVLRTAATSRSMSSSSSLSMPRFFAPR